MSNNLPKEILNKYPNYAELLLNSAIASRVVYEDEPITYLKSAPYSNFNHSLNKICISQSITRANGLKYVNSLNEIKYLIAELDHKRILVAFRGSQSRDDFLIDAKIHSASHVYAGQVHSGFYNRAESVPISYFIQKINQGYQLIFTGHSLGAAISCLIAVKLILNTRLGKENSDKVLFIGFGCPLIADKDFKRHIEASYKYNFHFIKNEEDVVVKALDFLGNKIHENEPSSKPSTPTVEASSFFSKIQKGWEIAKPLLQSLIPKYEHFGLMLQLDKSGLKLIESASNGGSSIADLGNLNTLIGQARNHFMNNYFTNLKSNHFMGLEGSNLKTYDYIKDLHLSENDKHFIRIIKRIDSCDIFVNFNFINNKENLLVSKLIVNESEFYNENNPLNDNLAFKFTGVPLETVFKNGKLVSQADLILIGHFNSACYVIKLDEAKLEEDLILKTKTTSEKRLETATRALSIGLKFLSKK